MQATRPSLFDKLNQVLTEFTPAGYLILCFLASSLISVCVLAFMAVASSRFEGGRASLEDRIAALEQRSVKLGSRVDAVTDVVLLHGEELTARGSPTTTEKAFQTRPAPKAAPRVQSIAQQGTYKEERNWSTLDAKLSAFGDTLRQTSKELK